MRLQVESGASATVCDVVKGLDMNEWYECRECDETDVKAVIKSDEWNAAGRRNCGQQSRKTTLG